MNDDISNYGKIPALGVSVQNRTSRTEKPETDATASRLPAATAKPAETPRGDTVELSESAQLELRAEQFDRAKVESIKQAIQNGQYPLDSRRIAENFYAIESLIKD